MEGSYLQLFMVQGVPILEGISDGNDCTVDILVKAQVPIIFEGIPGGDNCTDGHPEDKIRL